MTGRYPQVVPGNPGSVSYTHLDVYKRQMLRFSRQIAGTEQTKMIAKCAGGFPIVGKIQQRNGHFRGAIPVSYTHLVSESRRPPYLKTDSQESCLRYLLFKNLDQAEN